MNHTPNTSQFISRQCDNSLILQRTVDGYVNATAMCQASGKRLNHYLENRVTKDFLEELSADAGIPASELVAVRKGGIPLEQGTWVHPDVAINLGQWCSPKFAVAVSKWVREWMSGKAQNGIPYHFRRYLANAHEIPPTHFSILNEMLFCVIKPLEKLGFTLPENMLPDISEGRMFCWWLREAKGMDTDALPKYRHTFEDGRVVWPKLYPMAVLPDFRIHLLDTWIPRQALGYFRERAPAALPFVERLILTLPSSLRGLEY